MGKEYSTKEKIAFALRQAESDTSVARIIHKLGIAEARRLRILEEDNRRLEQLVADRSLDKKILRDVLTKKL